MKRRISEEAREKELKLWRATMRGVTPLRDWTPDMQPQSLQQKKQKLPCPVKSEKPKSRLPVQQNIKPVASLAAARFDAESERRLKAGQLRIDARLDLHGMTESRAHHAVLDFLTAAIAARHRMVLVVTGKGAKGTGVLNRNLSLWLEAAPASLRKSIQSVRAANAADGGAGAYYLLLSKKRH